MKVPEGSVAQVSLAIDSSQDLTLEKNGEELQPESIEGLASGSFKLGAGVYSIRVSSGMM
jgi:hypothetical protein